MKLSLTNFIKTSGIPALFVLAVTFPGPFAMAQDTGWYGGLNLGQSRANIDDDQIRSNLMNEGFTSVTIDDDGRGIGFKLFGGYQLHRNFSIEGGYFDLGKFGFSATTIPPGTLDDEITVRGVNLDLVGFLPVTERFSAFARAGVNNSKAKNTYSSTGLVTVIDMTPNKRDTNYKFGFGFQYELTEAFALRAEAERYRINDAVGNNGDIDLFSVGVVYRFGGKTAAPERRTTMTERSAPALVIVPVPVAARTQQYCSILDMQFEINQNTVQLEYEEKIDKVGIFMKKYPETTAVIEGHSDEVGTSADNLVLSQRRADGVVTYLVDRSGIVRSRLKAVGYGETRPIADNTTEIGKRLNRRINAVIACATDIEGITPVPGRITMAMNMEFDQNSADVKPQYHTELGKVAKFMLANPAVTATVEGHTSNQQVTPSQAIQLSQRRAENVVNTLVNEFKVPRSRLSSEGFGGTRRFAYNTSVEGQQENRRVNIIFDFPNR